MNRRPIVLARIGWMTFYRGWLPGDPWPKGGGKFPDKAKAEPLNFRPQGGWLRGYFSTGGRLADLKQVDPSCKNARHEGTPRSSSGPRFAACRFAMVSTSPRMARGTDMEFVEGAAVESGHRRFAGYCIPFGTSLIPFRDTRAKRIPVFLTRGALDQRSTCFW